MENMNLREESQAKDREIEQLNQEIEALLGIVKHLSSGSAAGGEKSC